LMEDGFQVGAFLTEFHRQEWLQSQHDSFPVPFCG
jgi:hypothetical protein